MTAPGTTAALPASVYVYYRVRGEAPLARAAIAAMMAMLEERTGVSGRLLCRSDDATTWMEVFAPVHDLSRFTRELASCSAGHDVARWAEGGVRHQECFVPLAATAEA